MQVIKSGGDLPKDLKSCNFRSRSIQNILVLLFTFVEKKKLKNKNIDTEDNDVLKVMQKFTSRLGIGIQVSGLPMLYSMQKPSYEE